MSLALAVNCGVAPRSYRMRELLGSHGRKGGEEA
jgi:hypothetical protein